MSQTGTCPSCHEEGEVATPCTEKVCRVRGYHRVPSEYLSGLSRIEPEIGILLDRRYLLVKLLGEGGFGRVFVALQLPLQMKVALKVLKPDSDPDAHESRMKSFRQEAKAMSDLGHPNIVKVLDFGFMDGAAYLVLEFLEGSRTLRDEVKARAAAGRDLTLDDVSAILTGVLHGLDEAHRRGLVHRDIKPDNIMLQAKPGHPFLPRILDFGLAKFVDSQTQSSAIMGTPAYMAPEQLTKRDAGPWTDLYALGVMAYELMTGRRPFPSDVAHTLAAKQNATFDVMEAVSDLEVPAPIARFLERALAFETSKRYRSADEFRVAMESALAAARGVTEFKSTDVSDLVATSSRDLHKRLPADEPVARKSRLGLWVGGLVAVGGAVAAVVLLSGPKTTEDPIPVEPVAAAEVVEVVAPDTSVSQAPEVAIEVVPDNAATIRDLLDQANSAAGQRKWDEAARHLEMALVLDVANVGAKALQAKVNAEKAVESAFGEAVAAQTKGDLAEAWQILNTKLAGMPPDSVYAPQVAELKTALGAALANGLLDQAKAAFTKKQWDTTIVKAGEAQKFVPNIAGAPELIAKAKKAKADAAAAKDEPEDPRMPEPAGKTGAELYLEARALHNTDKVAALRLYEQAAAKGHVASYKQIGALKINTDVGGAIIAFKKYLQFMPKASDADAVREMIVKLGGTP